MSVFMVEKYTEGLVYIGKLKAVNDFELKRF